MKTRFIPAGKSPPCLRDVPGKRRLLVAGKFMNSPEYPYKWISDYLDPQEFAVHPIGRPRPIRGEKIGRSTPPWMWLQYLFIAMKARLAMLARRYDCIVTASPRMAFAMALVSMLTLDRTPHIVWAFNAGRRYRGIQRFFSTFVLRRIDRFVTHSRRECRIYSSVLKLPPERFVFAYLSGPYSDEPAYREKPTLLEVTPPYIVSAGVSGRDYPLFLEVMAEIPARAVIVTYPELLAGLTMPPNVSVIGGISEEEYCRIVAYAELCVVPIRNRDTASGQVNVVQAMSLQCPIVATRCIGTEDYIEHEKTGLLVEMGDADGLSKAIQRLLADPDLRKSLARSAYQFARDELRHRAAADTLAHLVRDIKKP